MTLSNFFQLVILFFTLVNPLLFHAQSSICGSMYDANWLMGDMDNEVPEDRYGGSFISFKPELNTAYYHRQEGSNSTFALINSSRGEFIIYSNGCNIFDSRDSIIKNGTDINPGEIHNEYCPKHYGYPGGHTMFFLPSAYDTSVFYLIHLRKIINHNPDPRYLVQTDNFYISTVHATSDDGHPEVIDKNQIMFSDTGLIGYSTDAVHHANGLDWWILTPDRWSNAFHTLLIDQSGPVYLGKQFAGDTTNPDATGGQSKFSPDGKRFAWFHPRNGLFLYDFDRSSGFLSNFRKVTIPQGQDDITGGLEFSPSGRFLYINDLLALYQVDLAQDDLQASLVHIADYDGFGDPPFYTTFYYEERTPDNRIFINARTGTQWMHIIQEPEKKGTACRFEQHALMLPTVTNYSIPHFPNYRLGALDDPPCDSLMVSIPDSPLPPSWQLTLKPNPAGDRLYVQSPVSLQHVDLLSISGQLLRQLSLEDATAHDVDITSLPPGVYILRARDSAGKLHVQKFVKGGK